MKRRCVSMVGIITVMLLAAMPALAGVIYSNGFEGSVGPEWSTTLIDVTPAGTRRFLGQFGNDTVSLALSHLPAHSAVSLSFDLFVIRSWDGNYDAPDNPLNLWDLTADGQTLVHTTFALYPYATIQAYPGSYPGGSYAPGTGASENNTLGYTFTNNAMTDRPMDAVYRLSFAFTHTSDTLVLGFSGTGLQGPNPWVSNAYLDESWGLDNVQVSITPVPEPSSLLALGGGMLALAGVIRRRRRQA